MTPGTPFDLARPVEHPVVGQRYLLRRHPTEMICSGCGHVVGEDMTLEGDGPLEIIIVTVIDKMREGARAQCYRCNCVRSLEEGWWSVISAGWLLAVPWTWLYPLEGGDA